MVGLLAMAVNTPVYVSIPVQDAAIVDETLEKLDRFLVNIARTSSRELRSFFPIEQDAYQLTGIAEPSARAYAFRFGPVTWRFYWMRIDNGLYIASTPELIGDLLAASARDRQSSQQHVDDSQPAHGLVRLRPNHWDEIKPQTK